MFGLMSLFIRDPLYNINALILYSFMHRNEVQWVTINIDLSTELPYLESTIASMAVH